MGCMASLARQAWLATPVSRPDKRGDCPLHKLQRNLIDQFVNPGLRSDIANQCEGIFYTIWLAYALMSCQPTA